MIKPILLTLALLTFKTSLASALPHTNPTSTPLTFALIGDQPYGAFFVPSTDKVIQAVNSRPDVQWVLHVGDIKGGGERCDNDLLKARIAQLNQSQKPLYYTPGDNEWTDCHRDSNGNYNSQERLAFLRKIAFAKPQSLGQHPAPVLQQNKQFPENAMWRIGNTLFVTLNVPGSNNDLEAPASRKESPEAIEASYLSRERANEQWLQKAAGEFNKESPPTETVIAMQANPLDGSGGGWLGKLLNTPNGYASIMKAIAGYVDATQRPVLLAHGDTHRFVFDQPDLSRFDPSFKHPELFHRVEGWGHPFYNEWVRITVRSGQESPFNAESVSIQTGP
ncbi:metallophosphoesterase family protein [Limnobacter sp.]|uniref:metallophosphoesterase family protein n=1 Tax=Limnobacter sp. TaxID=2003368 RepID=UPI002589576F|nr:metallophosphoesterase family protein [Limnobacter sp.]